MKVQATTPQKRQIIETAAELFARQSYGATGIVEIADAVGLSKSALYHHISSKEGLLFEICGLHVGTLIDAAESILDTMEQPLEAVRQLSQNLMRVVFDHQAAWTVFVRDFTFLTGERREEIRQIRTRYEDCWREAIQRGVTSGEFREIDPSAVKSIVGMHNYSYLWVRRDGRLAPEQMADMICDLALYGLVTRT